MSPGSISVVIELSAVISDKTGQWEAFCPDLDICTQGASEDEAKENLSEAVGLWFESCLQRDTLWEALEELGWYLAAGSDSVQGVGPFRILPREPSNIPGDPFDLTVRIPAYQAAALTGGHSATPC